MNDELSSIAVSQRLMILLRLIFNHLFEILNMSRLLTQRNKSGNFDHQALQDIWILEHLA